MTKSTAGGAPRPNISPGWPCPLGRWGLPLVGPAMELAESCGGGLPSKGGGQGAVVISPRRRGRHPSHPSSAPGPWYLLDMYIRIVMSIVPLIFMSILWGSVIYFITTVAVLVTASLRYMLEDPILI